MSGRMNDSRHPAANGFMFEAACRSSLFRQSVHADETLQIFNMIE